MLVHRMQSERMHLLMRGRRKKRMHERCTLCYYNVIWIHARSREKCRSFPLWGSALIRYWALVRGETFPHIFAQWRWKSWFARRESRKMAAFKSKIFLHRWKISFWWSSSHQHLRSNNHTPSTEINPSVRVYKWRKKKLITHT